MELMTALAGVYDAAAPSLRFTAPNCRHGVRYDGGKQAQQAWRPTQIGQSSLAKVENLFVSLDALLSSSPWRGAVDHVFCIHSRNISTTVPFYRGR